jgi:DNA replication protein DnaC
MDETTVMSRRELESLQSLPPTADLEANLVRLEERQAAGGKSFVRWDAMLATARERVQFGRERDRLQCLRPDGCKCLGMGWWPEADPKAYLGDDIPAFCACPEGIAAEAEQKQRAEARRLLDGIAFIDRAGIPPRFRDYSFESYPKPNQTSEMLRAWRTEEGRGLFLCGEYGTGKTGLAVAVLKAHIMEHCVSGMFVTVPAILDEIRATYGKDQAESEAALVGRVLRAGFLVMDDLGAERPTEWVTEKLFTLINHRHDHLLPTIFTSNYDIPELAERLGERTTWRIVEMATVVRLTGPNLRVNR